MRFKNNEGDTPRFNDFFKVTLIEKIKEGNTASVSFTISLNETAPEIFKSIARLYEGWVEATYLNTFVVIEASSKLHEGDENKGAIVTMDIAEHKALKKAYNFMNYVFAFVSSALNELAYESELLAQLARKKRNKQENCYFKLGNIDV